MAENNTKYEVNSKGAFVFTPKEQKLIEELRKIPFGEVTVFQEFCQPVRIKKIVESVKL